MHIYKRETRLSDSGDCFFELGLSPTNTPFQYLASATFDRGGGSKKALDSVPVTLNPDDLTFADALGSSSSYQSTLTQAIFEDKKLYGEFKSLRDFANAQNSRLLTRLFLSPDSPDLHSFIWELLGEPEEGIVKVPMTANLRRPFSRYLAPPVMQLRRSTGRLKALVLIANPGKYGTKPAPFGPIDTVLQMASIQPHFDQETDVVYLQGSKACSKDLKRGLEEEPDVVYIVCHGVLTGGIPYLALETDDAQMELFDSRLLATWIGGSDKLAPQLVAFGSCESAGAWNGGALASVAASMIGAGVGAVVGMQGEIRQTTNAKFFDAFFEEIFQEGQVERAASAGRRKTLATPDWWMPVVLLARDDGQLWPSKPARQPFDWGSLLRDIMANKCTPILGSEVVPAFANRVFARKLLDEMKARQQFTPANEDELAWVAQQHQNQNNLRSLNPVYTSFVQSRIFRDGIRLIPNELPRESVSRWGSLPAVAQQLQTLEDIAGLPFSCYVTANSDGLLQEAIKKRGYLPNTQVCPWRGEMSEVQQIDLEAGGNATVEKPLVYHLFGSLEGRDHSEATVVITEDDYFRHLLWVAGNTNLIPIKRRLCDSSLLFLGFHLQDWEFRILLRCIDMMAGSKLQGDYTHVAVQVPPGGDPDRQRRAQEMLTNFFSKGKIILSIYYGTVAEFSAELRRQWNLYTAGGADGQ